MSAHDELVTEVLDHDEPREPEPTEQEEHAMAALERQAMNASFWSKMAGNALREAHDAKADLRTLSERFVMLRIRAKEVRDAKTDLERQLAASLLVAEVLS